MEYYYKTALGDIVELTEESTVLDLKDLNIVEINVPKNCRELNLQRNKLTKLEIPIGCNLIKCQNNQLTELTVPDCITLECNSNNIKKLIFLGKCSNIWCKNNKITEIIIPENCYHLDCKNNNLSKIKFLGKCSSLYCDFNELTEIILPGNLEYFTCTYNKLTKLQLPEFCRNVDCTDNNLTEIIVNENLKDLDCRNNKLTKIAIPNGCNLQADKDVVIKNLSNIPDFGKTDKAISDLILKIKNPILWSIADQLTKTLPDLGVDDFIDIKQLKKLANSNPTLGQMLSKKEGQALLISKQNKGLSLQDIQSADFFNREALCQNKNIEINHTKWSGDQRYFQKQQQYIFKKINGKQEVVKSILDNHVFRIDLKAFKNKEILETSPNSKNLKKYIARPNAHSGYPLMSSVAITLSRIRYTYLEDYNGIVIDEIQTDMDDETFLGKDLMQGWDEFTMKLFIQYVRKQYKIRKIYMPTYDSKKKLYDANPPMYLYKELPNKFGFKKQSDLEGFMVLEKFELPRFEDFSLI